VSNDKKSILLVEGTNDELFFTALMKYELIKEGKEYNKDFNNIIAVESQVDFSLIYGSDIKKIAATFQAIKSSFRTDKITNVGIILDIDNYDLETRLKHINDAVKISLSEFNIPPFTTKTDVVQFAATPKRNIYFSYFLLKNKAGIGNVEMLLKDIITNSPIAADCLNNWKECVSNNKIKIKPSDFQKEWTKFYVRYDYCNDRELNKHASENCTIEKALNNMVIEDKPKAWDFESETLNPLKLYLTQFK
jgi:hypothetical protein